MKKLLIFLALIFSSNVAFGLLPPSAYKQEIEYSEIKALAIVEKIKVTDWELGYQTKKVWFKTLKPLNNKTPKEFTGYCQSFKKKWFGDKAEPMAGGQIFHYPYKGQVVFVSVSENNGYITLFSEINEEMKAEIEKNGLKNLDINHSSIKYKK